MNSENKIKVKQKHYNPDDILKKYMYQRLQFETVDKNTDTIMKDLEKVKQSLKNLQEIFGSQGNITTEDDFSSPVDALEALLERLRTNLRTGKTRLLHDIIFPAMVNLTFFLGCIANHSELQKVFETDLKELYGVKRNDPHKTPYAFMLHTLLISLVTWSADNNYYKRNYRWKILAMMQEIIWNRSYQNLPNVFSTTSNSVHQSHPNIEFQKIFVEDISRARSWIGIIADMIPDEYPYFRESEDSAESTDRTLKVKDDKPQEDKPQEDKPQEDKPHRTFCCELI